MYSYKRGKNLRCGYTTGSCAAAAAKASAEMLLTGRKVSKVCLSTPKGIELELQVENAEIEENYACCCVRKDSGDDPDITNGMEIFGKVSLTENDITIIGGKGIGVVTKSGLDRPVGDYAINTVPRKMITNAVADVAEEYEYHGGFKVEIIAPKGEEIAKKTFNPRLGIVGGISIIGTTGIVEPMSSAALVETIRLEANQRRQQGADSLYLSMGNYSEQFIGRKISSIKDKCVMCSNYVGDAIDIGVDLGFKRILLIGHLGKLVKLGSGIMNTHSSIADGRMETLMACGVLAGIDNDTLCQLDNCVTTDAALELLFERNVGKKTLNILMQRVERYLAARVRGEAEIAAVIFSFKNELVLKTSLADKLLKG